MALVWFLLFLFTSPAMSRLNVESTKEAVLYRLLKNYDSKAAEEAFMQSGRKVYNFGMFLFLQVFDEIYGKATVSVLHRRAWRDTTLPVDVAFPQNTTIIHVETPWLWTPENFIPVKEQKYCAQYIRKPQWVGSFCNLVSEAECFKSKTSRYPKDRFTCRMRAKLSNSVRKQDIKCVNNTRLFWRGDDFLPQVIYPPLPCRNVMPTFLLEYLHEKYPNDWKIIGALERIVDNRHVIEFTLERFNPHFYKSDVLLGAIAGIVAVSISLFGLSSYHRLEICGIGMLIVLAHFQFTTEIPVVESGKNQNLLSLSIALICIQSIGLIWSIVACNLQLACTRLGALPPLLHSLFDRFIPSRTEDEGEDQENEKQWKAAILIMDHIVFAILSCGLLIIFPITLL